MDDDAKHNEGSYMYYRDYTDDKEADTQTEEVIQRNHKTEAALVSKAAAKVRGRGGRFRGKSGTQENNKARGGRLAR